MNATFPQSRLSHRLPRIFALAVASALGLGAAITAITLVDDKPQSPPFSVAVPVKVLSPANVRPTLYLYLVESQAQEDMVLAGDQEAAQERASANIVDPDYSIRIIQMTTPEDELAVDAIAEQWLDYPEGLRIIDLRGK
ncbi:MAG TPA: hypothetical protein VJB57_07245 [Dehalococcoidia bacterium]|nr:hypothetical protein [Dehalococcoidia bacterium]